MVIKTTELYVEFKVKQGMTQQVCDLFVTLDFIGGYLKRYYLSVLEHKADRGQISGT